ncbi:MAG TPA: M50 family metallopeptidase [Candidatus Saccharimonadales bacterium]|jgi:regulator of sigma E protease|nr:M50 family metallopeptidase [Candidatus Saccharimonadales bacterium]
MGIFLLVVGLILFVALVVVHEFGHFWIARRNGVEAEEFGIGFPPRAWSKKLKSGLVLSLNWLPIGGFVKLKGEHDADTEPGTFGAASFWSKTKIMLAGIGMNLLAAFVLFMILAWVGMPQLVNDQFKVKSDTKIAHNEVLVGYVESNSPAGHIGLKTRDQITAIGPAGHETKITDATQMATVTQAYANQKVTVDYLRNGQPQTATTTLRSKATVEEGKKTNHPKGYLGVAPTEYTLTRATWSAPVQALGTMWQFTALTFKGLWVAVSSLLQGNTAQASAQVSGPVGIFVILKDGSLLGYQFMLLIIAVISLTLAVMNVLPIPALDGGHLFVMLIARLLRKPLTQRVEEWVYGVSYVFLLGLVALITVVDVRRYF